MRAPVPGYYADCIMTTTMPDISAIIARLQATQPARHTSPKRAALLAQREALVALHQRGYSWRMIARELSTGETTFSPDLLRRVCGESRRTRRAARAAAVPPQSTPQVQTPSIRPAASSVTPLAASADAAVPPTLARALRQQGGTK